MVAVDSVDMMERVMKISERRHYFNGFLIFTRNMQKSENDKKCIVTWINRDNGEQCKHVIAQEAAFMLMRILKNDGAKNIAALLVEDDFFTVQDLRNCNAELKKRSQMQQSVKSKLHEPVTRQDLIAIKEKIAERTRD